MKEVTHISYDSIYTKCPEKTTLWSQKAGQWLPRAEVNIETDCKKSQENLGGTQKCSKAGL